MKKSRRRTFWIGASTFFVLIPTGCQPNLTEEVPNGKKEPSRIATPLSPETVSRIQRFCGDCHPMPLASTFPKVNWGEEVRQGFDFYIQSNRNDLEEPIRNDVIKYFQDTAPDKVIVPRADSIKQSPSSVRFQRSNGIGVGANENSPATAQVVWNSSERAVYYTDMYAGTLSVWNPSSQWPEPFDGNEKTIANGINICRATSFDWDGDGRQDFILGELGSFPVGDHNKGRVTLLFGGAPEAKPIVLGENFGRVIEAKPIDYDSDGDTDLIVADFGWRKTGALRLLRNVGGTLRSPSMQSETLDARHGVLGVEVADMDGDSKLDFVVAYGQEFESVEVYFNRGPGQYERKVIMQLPDPSYNSSAFQIVDLDKDGRLDVVHTCGDTMDAFIAKPYHGLRWVRNLGNGEWENRELGLLVGALQSTVADFDSDGDLDIAAVGLFPKAPQDGPGAYDSICWWEQKANLEFVRHSIERDHCAHATCSAGDVNGDGRVDLIVGEWFAEDKAAFRVFLNLKADVP